MVFVVFLDCVSYFRKAKLFHVLGIVFLFLLAIYVIANFDERTAKILKAFFSVLDDPSRYLNLFVLIDGNRLQRVMVAYDAFLMHPVLVIGIGALREYSTKNFKLDSFDLDGLSASDFSTEMNATNVFMEVMAEPGIIGLVGFLVVLVFVARKKFNMGIFLTLKISFFVTMISLLIESSYLRPYIWALYGIVIGISSRTEEKN